MLKVFLNIYILMNLFGRFVTLWKHKLFFKCQSTAEYELKLAKCTPLSSVQVNHSFFSLLNWFPLWTWKILTDWLTFPPMGSCCLVTQNSSHQSASCLYLTPLWLIILTLMWKLIGWWVTVTVTVWLAELFLYRYISMAEISWMHLDGRGACQRFIVYS